MIPIITEQIILTENEVRIIAILRSLHAYEKVTVTADQNGKPDYFIVDRTFREVLK